MRAAAPVWREAAYVRVATLSSVARIVRAIRWQTPVTAAMVVTTDTATLAYLVNADVRQAEMWRLVRPQAPDTSGPPAKPVTQAMVVTTDTAMLAHREAANVQAVSSNCVRNRAVATYG